jgi:hypothetical protein
LPLGDTFLLAAVLQGGLTALFAVIYWGFRLLAMLLVLVLSLLPGGEMALQPAPVAQEALPPPIAAPPFTLPPWLGGASFWLALVILVGYAAYFYFTDKDRSFNWLRRFWWMLVQRWAVLLRAWQGWRPMATRHGPDAPDGGQAAALPWYARLLPWRFLTPSQQVRYLYFALLDAAARHETARAAAETPHQYAPRLQERLAVTPAGATTTPELPAGEPFASPNAGNEFGAEDDARIAVTELTAAFVGVRYAGAAATPQGVRRLRARWNRLRAVLARTGDSAGTGLGGAASGDDGIEEHGSEPPVVE